MVFREVFQGSQAPSSLRHLVGPDQPARRLRQEEDKSGDHERHDEGDRQRQSPAEGRVGDKVEGEVDPVAEGIAETHEYAGRDDVSSTVCRGRTFCLPYWDGHAYLANTNTEDHTPDHKVDDVVGRDLEYLANDGQDGGQKYVSSSPEPVANEQARQGADQSSNLEGCYHGALAGRVQSLL